MIMNTTRKDTSKLLVTIMAIAMIFVGCAVLASSSGSNAAESVAADNVQTADSSVSFESGVSKVYYDTLSDAISAIQPETKTTITLLKDTEGIGIKIKSNCDVIIDFNNFTYNVTKTVGSTGTETNAVQLLKDSTVVFKNGTLTSDNAKRMIQNYTNLTLENMIIDASKMLPGSSEGTPVDYIAIASNNGNVSFKGTTSIIDKDASNDTTGRTAVSLAVSYWHPNYPDGTVVTFDEGFSGTVGDIIVDGTEGFSEAGKISKLVINSTEGKFGSIDATYGAIEIGTSAEISTTSFSIGSDVTVTNNGELTAENLLISGTLTNNGTYTNDGTTVLKTGAKFINNGTFSGNTVSAVSANQIDGKNGKDVPYLVTGGDDNLGLRGTLESDYTVTNLNYLSDNLVIKEGVTLTIASKGSFDLNGHTLTVNGTLVVERNGEVTAVAGGSVLLGAKGTIENSGVIGADSNVTVGIAPASADIVLGEVTLKNVTGMTFGITKTVANEKVTNTLTVGGTVTARGDNPAVTINGANITGEFSVNNLTMTVGSDGVTVLKNATFTIQSKAVVTGTGTIALAQNGATIVVNGSADISVVAETGEYIASETPDLTSTTIDVYNVKGLTITTGQYTYVNDDDETMIVKTMVMSGTLVEVSKDAGATIDILTATGENVGVTVSDTLNVDETVDFSAAAKVYVTGTIVSDEDLTVGANAAYINGTAYQVQTTDSTGATNDTYYITSFENAFGQIANAFENTITVYGDVEVSNEITVAADNTIEIADGGKLTIAESGRVNLDADANLSGAVYVDGILYCAAYSSYDDPVEYAAMSEDDDGNVTYAGLRAAIDNASEGDTVTIVKGTTLKESLTVPAGITLQVNEGVTLTFEKDLTIQEGAKVVNQGTINMSATSKLTVYGELDSSEGIVAGDEVTDGESTSKTEVYSTGTTIIGNNGTIAEATIAEATINAAYYTDDDNNRVITSAAKAAAAVAQKDVGKTMNLSGTFSESGDFTADGITITVNRDAKVSLGTVTLDDAKIEFATTGGTVAGTLTATIAAQTGADGSTTESSVAVSEANGATIESAERMGSDSVTTWYLYVYGANPVGKYTVSAGTVTLGTTSTSTVTFNGDNTLTVASGATLVVPSVTTLTAGVATNDENPSVTVEGTLDVVGNVSVTGYMYVTGTVDIEKSQSSDAAKVSVTGTLQVAGTVNVSETQDLEGTLEVGDNGALVLGDAPTTLGAAGTVSGPVDLAEDGYVKVYSGSTVDTAKLDLNGGTESNAVSTAFHINGTLYMTVYTAKTGGANFDTVLQAEDFEITGYDTTGANNYIKNGDADTNNYAWYAKADYSGSPTPKDTRIGTDGYENVYYQASLVEKQFTVSVGPGISLYVDGVRITTPTIDLGIGTYTVEAIVDPGYTGTTTITFNGQTVTGGTITVTADMVSDAYQGQRTIAASGAISQDSTVVIDGGSSGDSGMGLTDYLLIILVVLIVVMAIIVAMRLMRS